MKAGLFLLALGVVSASDLAKSGKSSSTRTRSGSAKSGKAALLKKNIAVSFYINDIMNNRV